MKRAIMVYGSAMAAGMFLLRSIEIQYAIRLFSTEMYIVVLAVIFSAIGLWIGTRLGAPIRAPVFEKNERAIRTLGLTSKEFEVLELLAEGGSNREIAEQLFVSTSTIKTHLIHLYQKLNVTRRTQAVQMARTLQIIP